MSELKFGYEGAFKILEIREQTENWMKIRGSVTIRSHSQPMTPRGRVNILTHLAYEANGKKSYSWVDLLYKYRKQKI